VRRAEEEAHDDSRGERACVDVSVCDGDVTHGPCISLTQASEAAIAVLHKIDKACANDAPQTPALAVEAIRNSEQRTHRVAVASTHTPQHTHNTAHTYPIAHITLQLFGSRTSRLCGRLCWRFKRTCRAR
jgi:hypothetical protein